MRGSRAVGSACVSRAGLKAWPSLRVRCSGVAPKHAFTENVIETKKMKRKGKSAIARTRSPGRRGDRSPEGAAQRLYFLRTGAMESDEQDNARCPSPASWRTV